MVADSFGIVIDRSRAVAWVTASLENGSPLARLMVDTIPALSAARLWSPMDQQSGEEPPLDDGGRGIQLRDADTVAESSLRALLDCGARTLVVEDDLARRADPGLGAHEAFVDDRVVRWVELRPEMGPALRLLRIGASGYPLNAFACSRSPDELGLAPGRVLQQDDRVAIARATCAVIVSVYDAEALVALIAPRLDG